MHVLKVLTVLLSAAALAVAGCGDSGGGGASTAKGNAVDRGFVADMVPHHMLAVEMATVAQERAESRFVKRLATDIVKTQNQEIDTMRREDDTLKAEGVKQGSLGVPQHLTGMDGDVPALRRAKPFDRAFLRMMIPHHEGAVAMARAELSRGKAPTLKALARSILKTQQREIREMREHLGGGGNAGGGHANGHGG